MIVWKRVVSCASAIAACSGCGGRVSLGEFGEIGSGGQSGTGGATATGGATTGDPTTTGGDTTGGAPTGGGGLGPSGGLGPPGSACWSRQLPPDPQPLVPKQPVAEGCDANRDGPWTFVQPSDSRDAKAAIVGRWASCTFTGALVEEQHVAVEFGANGRWQLLQLDPDGALIPAGAVSGMFYLRHGQLDLKRDKAPLRYSTGATEFSRDGQAFRYTSGGGFGASVYVRAPSTSANGRDNLPSLADGTCTLVGTWDSDIEDRMGHRRPLSISFDDAGNFVAAPGVVDLCATFSMYGTYGLSPGKLELTQVFGMTDCDFANDPRYTITFGDDCKTASTKLMTDGCTGGRFYFDEPTALVKRQ